MRVSDKFVVHNRCFHFGKDRSGHQLPNSGPTRRQEGPTRREESEQTNSLLVAIFPPGRGYVDGSKETDVLQAAGSEFVGVEGGKIIAR